MHLHRQGRDDAPIAAPLSAPGYRSPMDATKLLPSTVKGMRRKHKRFVTRSPSHPRRIPGYLPIPQVAAERSISPYWFYERIKKGTRKISRDQTTGLSLLPDTPETLERCQKLQAGTLQPGRFEAMYKDACSAQRDNARTDVVSQPHRRLRCQHRVIDRRIKMQDRRTPGCPRRAPS